MNERNVRGGRLNPKRARAGEFRGIFGAACYSALLFLAIGSVRMAAAAEDEAGFEPLFDGKTLDGWEGDQEIWSVEEGMIVGRSPGIRANQFLCTTGRFENFELRAEFLLVDGRGNTGIQFRSERVPGSTEVSGYQADLGEPFWGCLYDESRRRRLLACPSPEALARAGVTMPIEDKTPSPEAKEFSEALSKDGWNTYTIRAVGNQITLKINGFTTVDYRESQSEFVKPGIIGLQVHSGDPSEVRFRNLRIKRIHSDGSP